MFEKCRYFALNFRNLCPFLSVELVEPKEVYFSNKLMIYKKVIDKYKRLREYK